MRDSVVDTLSLWNSSDAFNGKDHDFMFIQFLLIDIFGGEALAAKAMDDNKLGFVEEVFAYRVKNCENRMASFKNHVDKVTDQFFSKLQKSNYA